MGLVHIERVNKWTYNFQPPLQCQSLSSFLSLFQFYPVAVPLVVEPSATICPILRQVAVLEFSTNRAVWTMQLNQDRRPIPNRWNRDPLMILWTSAQCHLVGPPNSVRWTISPNWTWSRRVERVRCGVVLALAEWLRLFDGDYLVDFDWHDIDLRCLQLPINSAHVKNLGLGVCDKK